jgi:hypothetical protein
MQAGSAALRRHVVGQGFVARRSASEPPWPRPCHQDGRYVPEVAALMRPVRHSIEKRKWSHRKY